MSYLFIKNLFQRQKFVLVAEKNKNLKNPKKTKNILVGFFRWFFLGFLGGFFIANLLAMVEAAVEGLHTEVILVPSQRDAHSHCVYPQPPFLLGSDCSPKIRYPVRLFQHIKAPYGVLYIFRTFISK
jgi:hypothetical protein